MSDEEKGEVLTQMRLAIGKLQVALEKDIESLEARMTREERVREKALDLQAKEYERRLDGLNHETARVLKMQSETVSRDTWNSFTKELTIKIDELKAFKERTQGEKAWSNIIAIIAGVIAVASAIINIVK